MSHVVILGAGLGGTIMAYELRERLSAQHKVSVVNNGSVYHFVPSNPWVGVGWRDREAVEVDLTKVFARHSIGLYPQGARRVKPQDRQIELTDGTTVDYDYLVIATGPDLAFDEIEGFGPRGPYPFRLSCGPCAAGQDGRGRADREPRAGGDRRGAGRILLRPGL